MKGPLLRLAWPTFRPAAFLGIDASGGGFKRSAFRSTDTAVIREGEFLYPHGRGSQVIASPVSWSTTGLPLLTRARCVGHRRYPCCHLPFAFAFMHRAVVPSLSGLREASQRTESWGACLWPLHIYILMPPMIGRGLGIVKRAWIHATTPKAEKSA